MSESVTAALLILLASVSIPIFPIFVTQQESQDGLKDRCDRIHCGISR